VGFRRSEPSLRSHRRVRPTEEAQSSLSARHRRVRGFGRLAVLTSLVAATVVIPVSEQAIAEGGSVSALINPAELPSTVSALTLLSDSGQVPASLQAAGPVIDRDTDAASRDLERDQILPGCDGHTPSVKAPNGQLDDDDLCVLWDGHTRARADYAVALAQFNEAFVARYGVDLCLTSGYRTLADQRAVKAAKGYLAATPGKSNHGLGLAVDFCTTQLTPARYSWMRENGPVYGIDNPLWARTTKLERWHWEFTEAVESDNSYTGSTSGSQGT